MLIIAFFVPYRTPLHQNVISDELRGEILFIMQICHPAFNDVYWY